MITRVTGPLSPVLAPVRESFSRVNVTLAWIHPVLGNPIFQSVFTFYMGGFLVMTSNAGASEKTSLHKVQEADGRDEPDKLSGHRQFARRESIQEFLAKP